MQESQGNDPSAPPGAEPRSELPARPAPRATRHSHFVFRYRLGDITLATHRLPVREVQHHFLADPTSLEEIVALAAAADGEALLGRSVPIPARRPPLERRGHLVIYTSSQYRHHYIDLRSGSFDTYLAGFSSKTRSAITRKVRKLEAASGGRLDWQSYRTPADVGKFLPEALALSSRTYQHQLLRAGLPSSDAFRAELLEAAARDAFRGYLLRLAGAPIAYLCCPSAGRALLYEWVGYDREHAARSPGTVLQYLALKELFAERSFHFFDFTEGDGAHKELFGRGAVECGDLLVLRRGLPTSMLLGSHRLFRRGAARLTDALERFNLKQPLKRLLRRGG
jgi:CelD/BcsL family acetyltransferase involved in cellulose biosynthesis